MTVYECRAPGHWACRIDGTMPSESCGQCPKLEVQEEEKPYWYAEGIKG